MALKVDINEIIEYRTKGAIIRCKADWTELGEKPTSYVLNKEKQRRNSSTLDALIVNGTKITHQLQI